MIRHRPRPRGETRHGKTMIEMMVVIASSSLIVSLAAGLFHHLSRTERAFRDSAVASRAQTRLVRDFRHDARRAQSAQPTDKANRPGVAFEIEDRTVTYISAEHGLVRKSPGEATHDREEYRLGDVVAEFAIADGLATLIVTPQRLPPPAKPRSVGAFRLMAAVGADDVDYRRPFSRAAPVIAPHPMEARP